MSKGLITEIQRFSTEDGPGIRSTIFCKGCNNFCPWCHNPETISGEVETLFYEELCLYCDSCRKYGVDYCTSGALQVSGLWMNHEEAASILLEDKVFYDKSGGGVTFSGGEPLLQRDFVLETARILKEQGIHIIVDTAMNLPYSYVSQLNPLVDSYYVDLKGVDRAECLRLTGVDLDLVLDNIHQLLKAGKELLIRIPVIPGYSDTRAYMEKARKLLEDAGAFKEKAKELLENAGALKKKTQNPSGHPLTHIGACEVKLLPFHNLGAGKYKALGLDYAYGHMKDLDKEKIKDLEACFI